MPNDKIFACLATNGWCHGDPHNSNNLLFTLKNYKYKYNYK